MRIGLHYCLKIPTLSSSGWVLVALAISLLEQAALATVCIPGLARVYTWSPDPLANAAACIAAESLCHRSGRCMRSVHESREPTKPVAPLHQQGSAFFAHKEVRIVFWCMLAPVVLATIWGGIILRIARRDDSNATVGDNWSLIPQRDH